MKTAFKKRKGFSAILIMLILVAASFGGMYYFTEHFQSVKNIVGNNPTCTIQSMRIYNTGDDTLFVSYDIVWNTDGEYKITISGSDGTHIFDRRTPPDNIIPNEGTNNLTINGLTGIKPVDEIYLITVVGTLANGSVTCDASEKAFV